MQQAVTFSSGGERTSRIRRVDPRRLAGCLAGGLTGGLLAWPFASIIGSLTHLHWLGAAGAIGAAVSLTAALGSVDREESPAGARTAGASAPR